MSSEMYTFKVKDLMKELSDMYIEDMKLPDFEVFIMTHDDMEYEVTEAYLDKEEKRIYLRGDQRFDEDWWKL
jgi:hypothetical protein